MPDQLYIAKVDGYEITSVLLLEGTHETQEKRNVARREIAIKFKIPVHYIRLQPANRAKYKWCKITNKNIPI